ncbi:MAG: radical SAM protein, partial [Candidatus Omnitrophica bacterium]|nr:radical SAM protein [Candidatus Omnitrophota bacterium]
SLHKVPSIKIGFRGETTLHPELPKMVKYAKEKGIMEIQFNTNGLLLDKALAKQLVKAGTDRIIFSLDGLRPATYNMIRIGSDYRIVTQNIKNLIKIRDSIGMKKPIVRIQMVCFKATKDEVIDFVIHWKRIVNRINLIRYKKPITTGYDRRRLSNIPTKSLPCRQLWQRLAVLWNGEVVMCCGDYKAEMSLGSIYKKSLLKIWRSKKLNRVRNLHSQMRMDEISLCRRCEINKVSEDGDWSWLIGKENI